MHCYEHISNPKINIQVQKYMISIKLVHILWLMKVITSKHVYDNQHKLVKYIPLCM